ncbi:MAG: hypothetical protein H9864_04130 [Candidatus Faecalibacterium intestinavium]|uniref:Uncharacterized protein n=1 Tax=Candidatus Faecalibacterium intestinavium TaxID=2838580 RepID=A0A9E2KKK9_9FIRM|nr:hypothetical protein [Candidatus Faecalibacterium intestinavium]
MQNLRMPAQYAEIPAQELRTVEGGGPVLDALGALLENIQLTNVILGSSVLFISFTFAPRLLFDAVGAVFRYSAELYQGVQDLFGQLLNVRL